MFETKATQKELDDLRHDYRSLHNTVADMNVALNATIRDNQRLYDLIGKLEQFLGVTYVDTHVVGYKKKGGPENNA